MFRSLANLISHKRSFCRLRSKRVLHVREDEEDLPKSGPIVIVQPEPVETVFPEKDFDLMDYSPSIELLKEAGILAEIEERPLIETLKPTKHSKSKLPDIIKRLKTIQASRENLEWGHHVFLEPLKETSKAMFQNIGNDHGGTTMGSRYADLVKARQLASVFVGPDNKIIEPGSSTSCSSSNVSRRSYSPSVSSDISYTPVHRFPCTKCPASYTRIYRTVNHMVKVHKMSDEKAAYERKLIQIKAVNLHKLKEPKLSIEKLSKSEIKEWTSSSSSEGERTIDSFKLALESVSKSLCVRVNKLSPSKIGPKSLSVKVHKLSPSSIGQITPPEVCFLGEEEKQNLNFDESDNEVILNRKRSRSASPDSSESSKIENGTQNRSSKDNSEKASKRRALSTKIDENNRQVKKPNKELQLLTNGTSPAVLAKKRPRRLVGPASVIKSRELKQLLMK